MNAKRRRQRARRNKQVRKQANAGAPSIVPAQLGAESKSRLDRVIAQISSIGLKLRNKLTELEAASLVSIPLSILLSLPAYFLPQTAPSLHVTLDDVLDKLKAHDANFEKDPRVARTFWLLHEPGASITLGLCPSPQCYQFTLGQLRTVEGAFIQEILLSGEGFGIQFHSEPDLIFEMDAMIQVKGSALSFNMDEQKVWVPLRLERGNFFEMSTKFADISFKVLDTRSDSLRIHLEIRHGTHKPLRQQLKEERAKQATGR